MLHERDRLGLRIVAVAFAAPRALAGWSERLGLRDVTVLADPERMLYRAFGFGRGSVARVWLDPRVWRRYAVLIAGGRRFERAHEDTLQLGADVIVGADGRILWIYRSRGPEDRPTLAQLGSSIASLSGG